jgi:hypothetical protein
MERTVKTKARIYVPRKIVRRRHNRLQGRSDEIVSVRLRSRQGARIAAKEGKMRREFLTKRHIRFDSYLSCEVF